MKFHTLEDKKMFLIECGRSDLLDKINESYEPSQELQELFLKKRRKKIPTLKNFKKSQATSQQWRKKRFKMMRGIKDFHKSTSGKRFHRALGRFIATRDFRSKRFTRENYNLGEVCEVLKALSSAKTQSYITLEYYKPADKQADFELFIEEIVPIIEQIEKSLVVGKEISEEELDLLVRITDEKVILDYLDNSQGRFNALHSFWAHMNEIGDPSEIGFYLDTLNCTKHLNEEGRIISTIAERTGHSYQEVERSHNRHKANLVKEGIKKYESTNNSYFPRLFDGIKKDLKLD